MQMIHGAVRISGSGPRHANVEIVNARGDVVARCKADSFGEFCADNLNLEEGEHELHVRCTRAGGGVVNSEAIEIEVQAADGSCESDPDDLQSEARAPSGTTLQWSRPAPLVRTLTTRPAGRSWTRLSARLTTSITTSPKCERSTTGVTSRSRRFIGGFKN